MNDSFSLTYELTMYDVITWIQYHHAHSASYKRLYWMQVTFLCAILFVAYMAIGGFNASGIIAAAIGTLLVFCVILSQRKRGIAKQVRRAYAEGKNKGMIGRHRMVVAEDGIASSSDIGEAKINWAGIERIVEIPGYTFVYFGALSALVIPERGVTEGDYSVLVAELKRRWEAAQAPEKNL